MYKVGGMGNAKLKIFFLIKKNSYQKGILLEKVIRIYMFVRLAINYSYMVTIYHQSTLWLLKTRIPTIGSYPNDLKHHFEFSHSILKNLQEALG